MAGKFEMYRDEGGKFVFRLRAENGDIILHSQAYPSQIECSRAIRAAQDSSKDRLCYVDHSPQADAYYFNLVTVSGEILGTNQIFSTESGRANGVKRVTRCASVADVVDLYSAELR